MYYYTDKMGRKATRTPWEKVKARRNYALSQRTIENLDYLITEKYFSSETEAIELAIEHLTTEYRERDKLKGKKALEKEV